MLKNVGRVVQFSLAKADDIPRLGAKPEMWTLLRPSTRYKNTRTSKTVGEHQSSRLILLTLSNAAMSKYGVLVMGPAGAGKVCASPNITCTPFLK